jgi:hypothetical protein
MEALKMYLSEESSGPEKVYENRMMTQNDRDFEPMQDIFG